MIKKFTLLLLVALSLATTAKAKTVETSLWNETYTDGVELNSETVATFKAGDVLRVYVTVPEGGANFKIVYKTPEGEWPEATIPSINTQWPWVNGGNTYYDLTFTSEDITTLSGKYIYIYKGENSTINEVSHIHEVTPSGTTNIYTGLHDLGNWSGLQLTTDYLENKLANAKIGDVLRVTYTSDEAGQINFCNSSYANFEDGSNSVAVTVSAATVEFEITTGSVLESIQGNGVVINGQNALISAVDLLTYDDSYDAVSVTIGDDGIATFSSSKKLDFSGTGITAYYASAIAKGSITLTSTTNNKTWDYCGYILRGAAKTYTIRVTSGDGFYPSKTYLQGKPGGGEVEASTTSKFRYIFAKKKDDSEGTTIGFYKLTSNHTLDVKKAYLETDDDITPVAGTRGITLDFGDGTTAILNVISDKEEIGNLREDGVYYTLQGTRVQNPSKGLYILNGKKVIVK